MRFPRIVRFDAAERQAFPTMAEPGEWAISGAFVFSVREPGMLIGKDLAAFRSGFLGVGSFGWESRVEVAEITDAEYRRVVETLAQHLLEHFDAPDLAAASAFAEEECSFAQGLCDRAVGTLLAVERSFGAQGIAERFRIVERESAPMSR